MENIEMRVPAKTEDCVQEMSVLMRQEIDTRILARQLAGEQIDRQWKPVNLHK